MSDHQKTLLISALVISISVVGFTYAQLPNNITNDDLLDLIHRHKQPKTMERSYITKAIIYNNEQYNFQLTFPNAWQNYKVFNKVNTAFYFPTHAYGSQQIVFCLHTAENWDDGYGKDYFCPVYVIVTPKVGWQRFQMDTKEATALEQNALGEYKGEKNNLVFSMFVGAQDYPRDLKDTDLDLQYIFNSFKFTK